jgi:hypothetical protein
LTPAKETGGEYMYNKGFSSIDVEKLRKDMRDDRLGAYFSGGFGAALVESADIDRASPEKLIEVARKQGIDLRKYQK